MSRSLTRQRKGRLLINRRAVLSTSARSEGYLGRERSGSTVQTVAGTEPAWTRNLYPALCPQTWGSGRGDLDC